jgi:two-component system sensor histidine kinase RegB
MEFFYVRLWRDDAPDPTIEFLASQVMFLLLLVLVAGLGVRLNDLRREQQIHVSSHAGNQARERYLLSLAALSAGTAHEMCTPLMTMGMVLGDLRRRENPPHDWKQSIDLLWEQTQICKRSLFEMALASNVERLGMLRRLSARQLLHDVGNRFQLQRPSVSFRLGGIRIDDSLILESDDTLSEALLKFLDSAADASPHSVELRAAARKTDKIVIHVLDRRPGAAPQLREPIASGPITINPRGRGSGAKVLIAQAVIERFGGTVQIFNRTRGGTGVQIELPMSRSNEEKDHEYREPRIASG